MRRLPLAEALRVKRPCRLPWDGLTPVSDRARHCEKCDKVVRDISALTLAEAEALVRSEEARERGLCGRIERRTSDGAIRLADGYAFPASARAIASRKTLTIAATVASFGLAACASQPTPVPELVSPPVVSEAPLAPPAPKPAPKAPVPEPNDIGLAAPVETEPEPEPQPQPVAAKPVVQAGKPSSAKPHPAAKGGKKKPKHEVILGDMY